MQKLHILAIAAHPDDIELSAAGTIIKHAKSGQAVGILDLTQGELGTRGNGPLRLKEAEDAANAMGVAVRENLRLEDGFFQNNKDSQLKLIRIIRKYQPDIIITNALEDRHPDHGKGAKLVSDACFLAGLRKIETEVEGKAQSAWRPKRIFHMIQDRFAEPTFIVDISDTLDAKMDAIKCYKSQFHDPESNEPISYIAQQGFLESIMARASLLGKRIGVRYGEGFICENIPGISDLDQLLYPQIA
jgi:bacillithiol biosynthesis deacetylase BshB1